MSLGDAQSPLTFLEEYDDMVQGAILLHSGAETFGIRERVLAVPWWPVGR